MRYKVQTINKSTGAEGTVVVRAADAESARRLVAMDTRVMAAEATQVPDDEGVAGGGLGYGVSGPGKPDQVSASELGAIRRELETINRSMLIRHPIWTIVIAILTAWLVLTLLGWVMTLTGFALFRSIPQ